MNYSKEELLLLLGRNPVLAHRTLFKHRHPSETQPFHDQLISDWHSDIPRLITVVFRGGAKSTIAEEAIVLRACYGISKFTLVVCERAELAMQRLSSISYELKENKFLFELFGDSIKFVSRKEDPPTVELANGAIIMAAGREQSIRGMKHLHYRPDLIFLDDLENERTVRSETIRNKVKTWFGGTLDPMTDPSIKMRMAATPLHEDSLMARLAETGEWVVRTYPIINGDPSDDDSVPAWPDRYPKSFCVQKKASLMKLGLGHLWEQEYMCNLVPSVDMVFDKADFKTEPVIRTWQPVYAVYDPARTVKSTSAHTGKVVGSWVNNRLILWEADGYFWKPDEIIEDIFKTDTTYNPILIGVEEDGLHEFIMQPLRHAQVARSHMLPLKPLKAPKGKTDFIKSLQPYFKAGEIIFANDRSAFANLENQLLSFPSGRIDVPNALAYFLTVRYGVPIYDGFTQANIGAEEEAHPRYPLYACVNATQRFTTMVMVQLYRGKLRVIADYVRDGDPGSCLVDLIREAGVQFSRNFTFIAAPHHFEPYDNIGLYRAAVKSNIRLLRGGNVSNGREALRVQLTKLAHGAPSVSVHPDAVWVLRAFAGGYAREFDKNVTVDNAYKVLMEGLESFAGSGYILESGTVGVEVTQARSAFDAKWGLS